MANPLFNEPVKCRKCGREFPADKAEGHACVPLWLQGFLKVTFKALAVFTFAMLVGLGFGLGLSFALDVKPIVIGAVVHGCE